MPSCVTGRPTSSSCRRRTTPCQRRSKGFLSLQERSIGGQLEDGIRGPLFDAHYADRLANRRTRTYLASPADFRRRDPAGRCEPAEHRGSGEAPRQARIPRQRRAGRLPVPYVLRAWRHAPSRRTRGHPRFPRDASGGRGGRHQPGPRGARRLRRSGRGRRPGQLRLRAAARLSLADAPLDDRARPAACRAGGEPGGRGALVPARLRAPHAGDPIHVRQPSLRGDVFGSSTRSTACDRGASSASTNCTAGPGALRRAVDHGERLRDEEPSANGTLPVSTMARLAREPATAQGPALPAGKQAGLRRPLPVCGQCLDH
jgi:hypothetical protein